MIVIDNEFLVCMCLWDDGYTMCFLYVYVLWNRIWKEKYQKNGLLLCVEWNL